MTEENNKQVEEVKIPVEEAVLPQPGSLVLSTSPHVHDGETISGIMLKVLICLMPVIAASVVVFGFNAVRVIVYCTVFCAGLEYLWNVCTRQPQTVRDLSAVVTGVILALNLPSMVPWWICLVGSFFAMTLASFLIRAARHRGRRPGCWSAYATALVKVEVVSMRTM